MCKIFTLNLLFISTFFSATVSSQTIDQEPCLSSSWEWAKAIVSNDSYGNSDMSAGPDGSIYVTGSFTGNITINDAVFESKGGADVYLLKYNAAGLLLWGKVLGSKRIDEAIATVSDDNGNVYLTGTFSDTLTIEGQQVVNFNNSPDIFLIKLDVYGDLVWLKHYGGDGYDHPGDLIIDEEGALYLSGGFDGNATIGGTIINSATEGNSFLLKLNTSGERIWLAQFGDVEPTNIKLALKSTNNIIVGGNFSTTLNIQTNTLESDYNTAVFIAEFSSDGTLVWLKKVTGGEASGSLAALSVDGTDALYIGGSFFGDYGNEEFQVGDSLYAGSGGYLAKLKANGTSDWSRRLTSNHFNYVNDIAIDHNNSVFATGLLTAALDFGGDVYNGFGGFVAKYGQDGSALKLWEAGSFSYERVNLITADLQGNIYCTGAFEGSIDFGSTNLIAEGGYEDAFVARLNANKPILAYEPDNKAGSITFSPIAGSSVEVFWEPGDGEGRLVIMKESGNVDVGGIADGNVYDENGTFGAGSQIGSNQFVVYKGAGSMATITGLESNKTYSVAVIEYNENEVCPNTINYKTDDYTSAHFSASTYLGTTPLNAFHGNFEVYPNPVGNEMNIILNTPYRGERIFKLIDQRGRLLHSFTMDVATDITQIALDLSPYQMRPGIYFLKINDENMQKDTYRILKK